MPQIKFHNIKRKYFTYLNINKWYKKHIYRVSIVQYKG